MYNKPIRKVSSYMGIEFELKYRATEDILSQLQKTVPGEEIRYEMETTYYDTPTEALSTRHYTLRRRQENNLSVCTLKTPAAGISRNEFEVLAPTIEEALKELCKLSGLPELPVLLEEGIQPVCSARFTRIAKAVTLPTCQVELALDQGILSGGGRQLPLCEIEVELKSGDPAGAQAYGMQLALAYGLVPETASKFRRARDLAKGVTND